MALTITFQRDPARPHRIATTARTLGRLTTRAAARALKPHRNALTNLAHMPLSLAGLASVDFAAFHLGHGWGWLATGASLIIAELAAADTP